MATGSASKEASDISLIIVMALVLVGAFILWTIGDNSDAKTCKDKYGPEYSLYHSPANSSVKSCVGPHGEVRAL